MNIKKHINTERRDFELSQLNEIELHENPFELFEKWLSFAIKNEVNEPNAFCFSSVQSDQPSSRILYIRDVIDDGFVFYTNYNSRKGENLARNNKASMNFFWPEMERQIRIEGEIEKAPEDVSDAYFASRPRASQIGAWASNQSSELTSRDELNKIIEEYTQKFEGTDVPRPEFWGGYILKPHYFEFWQGRKSRLHDRFAYSKKEKNWSIKRLFP